jgi:chromosome segregation ATPase
VLRRIVFLTLGLLEFLAAVVLFVFAWDMPGAAEVHDGVARVQRVTEQTSTQVSRLREELHTLRDQRPRLRELADNLQTQMRLATDNLRDQRIDYDTVHTVEGALGDVAKGLDGLSDTLNPDGVRQVGGGLKDTADLLDEKIAPAADRAADQLDQSTEALRTDAEQLSQVLRDAPLDLKAAREIHDGLARFGEGLDRLNTRLDAGRLDALRDGFKGMEEALSTGADQVERLSGYSYPSVRLAGLKPVVEPQPFWPEGKKIADGLRRAASGASAAQEEVNALGEDLPKLRESLNESRKVADATRDALGTALKQQDKIDALLKNAPEHAARLAERLPKLGADLSKVLRETKRLKDVAGVLREAQKGLDEAAAHWPELRNTLAQSAKLLRATQAQLRNALAHRDEYEKAMNQTVVLARTFSSALPLMTEQLEDQLREQEDSLQNLGDSIDQTAAVLPEWDRTAARVLETTRLFLCLMGAIFGLHGAYLTAGAWARRPAA